MIGIEKPPRKRGGFLFAEWTVCEPGSVADGRSRTRPAGNGGLLHSKCESAAIHSRMARPPAQDPAFAQAVAQHQAGRIDEAIRLYRQVVRASPGHAAAHNLLGIACHQRGDTAQAVESMRRALALKPDLPGASYNLGTMLQALRRYDEAIEQYRKALALDPGDAEAHNNLGSALNAVDRHADAAAHFEKAAALRPDFAEAHANLGNALRALERYDVAAARYQRAIALRPQFVEAYLGLGRSLEALGQNERAADVYTGLAKLRPDDAEAHMGLGNALTALGRAEEAVASYRRALALRADWPELHFNLGNAFEALRRHEDAIRHFRHAVALRPDYADAHVNLGNPLQLLNRYEEAIEHYRKALALKPELVVARTNLGTALQSLGHYDEALREYDEVVASAPGYREASYNKSLMLLSLGRLSEGWDLYDHRWDPANTTAKPRPYPQPRWDGGSVGGPLLVWGEQGLGDQILYSGLVPELEGKANPIVLEVEPRLIPLLARSFPGVQVVPLGEALYQGPVAAHTPIAGLAQHLRRSRESFPPRDRGYLVADPARASELRGRLARERELVVGLSWRSQAAVFGHSKSAQLPDFEPFLRLPGCRFVDLQYGDTRGEIAGIAERFGIAIERLPDIDNTKDIDGLAALIAACDLVVTVSNTTAHLAGALGKPTWVMAPHGNARIWYWFKSEPKSLWYLRVNVRHQDYREPWAGLAARTAAEIKAELDALRAGASAAAP